MYRDHTLHLALTLLCLASLHACSEKPPARSKNSGSMINGIDQNAAENDVDRSNNENNSDLTCQLTASPSSVVFGKAVTMRITTSEKPTFVSIDGMAVDPNVLSIRYTPQTAGPNRVFATIQSNEKNAVCETTITATRAPIPLSASCTPNYQVRSMGGFGTWLGADVGHAFNVSENRTLSLYGDTYLGPSGSTTRSRSQMVGNTIGISSCQNGVFSTTLHWWGIPTAAKPFFQNSDATFDRYWATNLPWKTGTHLYVPLNAIQNTADSALGFRSLRTDVAIITNPDSLPSQWQIIYKPLFNISSFSSPTSQGSTNFWGGIYNVPHGDFIYFYNNSANDLTMARLSADALAKSPLDPSGLIQYLAKDGAWKAGYVDSDAKRLGIPANTSLSVRYNFKLKKWIMVYFDTSVWISSKIYMRLADRIEGPWSNKIPIYDVPEVTLGQSVYDSRHFCYQAFEHLEFNPDPDHKLSITYACNANDLNYVASNLGIYFPKFITVPIPGQLGQLGTPD